MYSVMKENNKYIGIRSSNDNHLSKLEFEMVRYAKTKFNDLCQRVKRKSFEKENFTNVEFLEWIMNHDDYRRLYTEYINNDRDRNIAPSVDRLDDYKSYSFDNIRLTTWKNNKDKYNSDRLIGKNTKQSKPVIGITINGDIRIFHSAHYASQQTKTDRSSINRSCRTNSKNPINKSRSGSFIWIFQDDYNKLFS